MIPGLKRELESAISEACLRLFGVPAPRIVLETPPKVELGDLACPVAFELAKVLKRPPRDRKSTRLNSSHGKLSRMPSSA